MNTNSTMVLDFEKNIVEIEAKIEGLKLLAKDEDVDIAHEVNRLQQKLEKQVKQSYANLTPLREVAGGPPSGPSALPGLRSCPH